MKTTEIDALLADHRFFDGLSEADRAIVAACGRMAVFPAGEVVHVEGDEASEFFVVRRGLLAIETHGPRQEPIVLETVGPGSVVGFSWLFPPYRWRFDVRAVDDVHAISLDGGCLRGKCEEDPRLGMELMRRFAGLTAARLEATRVRLLDLYGTHDGA